MNMTQQARDDVIIVDPNRGDYDAILVEWSTDDIRIRHFLTGNDALRAARPRSSALWLVNTRLPDVSSVEFLATLRRRVLRATVFLVGDAYSPADEFAARLAGATAYVCKPPSAAWLDSCCPHCRSPAIRAGPVVTMPCGFS